MKRVRIAALLACGIFAGCQGSYSSAPQVPNTLSSPPAGGAAAPSATSSAPPNTTQSLAVTPGTQTYAVDKAAAGFACPEVNGYSCLLRFNVPPETPAPSPSASGKVPTAAPTPTASSSAAPGGSPSPSASPAGATISLTMTALPADAPKMLITGKNQVATTPLIRILLVPSQDFTLDGRAIAQFTLPKDQVVKRGFAVQLWEETIRRKKHDLHPIVTLPKSSLDKQTLTFSFTPPKLTLPKGRHYFIILYGDERAPESASPSPSSSPSPTPTGSVPPAS